MLPSISLSALLEIYDFPEVRGVEKAIIQQIVASVEEQYWTTNKNIEFGHWSGNIWHILTYLVDTYGNISQIQLSDFLK